MISYGKQTIEKSHNRDKILITPTTFAVAANNIIYLDFVPVLVDPPKSKQILSLPIYPTLNYENQLKVISTLLEAS